MATIQCIDCHGFGERASARALRCSGCNFTHRMNRQTSRQAAYTAVARAIRHGDLARPSASPCTDCGGPADRYDHRDYTKPLDVDPVCRSCNHKRGPAIQPKPSKQKAEV